MKTTNFKDEGSIRYQFCPVRGMVYMFFGEPVRETNKITESVKPKSKGKNYNRLINLLSYFTIAILLSITNL